MNIEDGPLGSRVWRKIDVTKGRYVLASRFPLGASREWLPRLARQAARQRNRYDSSMTAGDDRWIEAKLKQERRRLACKHGHGPQLGSP